MLQLFECLQVLLRLSLSPGIWLRITIKHHFLDFLEAFHPLFALFAFFDWPLEQLNSVFSWELSWDMSDINGYFFVFEGCVVFLETHLPNDRVFLIEHGVVPRIFSAFFRDHFLKGLGSFRPACCNEGNLAFVSVQRSKLAWGCLSAGISTHLTVQFYGCDATTHSNIFLFL